jgi:hypothetical protein
MTIRIATLCAALVACGEGAGSHVGDAPPGETPGYRLDSAGTINIVEVGGVWATLYDQPIERPLPVIAAAGGDCVLYQRALPSCPAGCPEACIGDNTCGPYARYSNAGDITITGLRQPATLTPSEFGYVAPSMPPDMFADDAMIHIAAAGGPITGFSADMRGVAPLEDSPQQVVLHDGEDHAIHWKPVPGDARIEVALYLGWHGAPWTDLLICETADDGELVIPAQVFAPMSHFSIGLFQWASWVARFRRTYVEGTTGPIEIKVANMVPVSLSH